MEDFSIKIVNKMKITVLLWLLVFLVTEMLLMCRKIETSLYE